MEWTSLYSSGESSTKKRLFISFPTLTHRFFYLELKYMIDFLLKRKSWREEKYFDTTGGSLRASERALAQCEGRLKDSFNPLNKVYPKISPPLTIIAPMMLTSAHSQESTTIQRPVQAHDVLTRWCQPTIHPHAWTDSRCLCLGPDTVRNQEIIFSKGKSEQENKYMLIRLCL